MKKENTAKYSNVKVLVVDDHMLMRNIISQNLRTMNFKNIETASTGKDAWQEINAAQETGTPYNIVFLDWHMPDMEGFEVLEKCREDKRFDDMAIVMLTAEQEQKNIIKAIQKGATSYLVKPVSGDSLEGNIKKVIDWLSKKKPELLTESQNAVSDSANKKTAIPDKIRNELKPVVAKGIENIFSEIFCVKIIPDDIQALGKNKELVCIGKLHQKNITIALRFFFDHDLLKPLLAQLYAPQYLENEDVYADAACEIVNILCGQIKAFLNQHGYNLELDLPQMALQDEKCKDANSIMNIHFTLNKDQDFLISVSSAKN